MDKQEKPISCVEIISFIVFIMGTLLLFAKTSDLMTNFAPSEFMGYANVEGLYGFGVALMVEGLIVAMKIKMLLDRSKSMIEWAWDIILTFVPFAISAAAQTIDSFVIRETINTQPMEIRMLVDYGVPVIPALIVFMLLVRGFIESAPAGMFAGITGNSGGGFKLPKFKSPFTGKSKKAPASPPEQ